MTVALVVDVDGTLVTSAGECANKLHRRAFEHAIQSVFGITTNIDVVAHHGSTDPLILLAILEYHGVDKMEVRGS